ncbi:hypothetical protein BDP27DRAFT_1460348 [Rhodocollybia butyracea]|uniref:Nudix hydrolase domain-containing protein n=1 Tax=Rhodocollybia butyracea TaxID=206335 RepID=A0A9P5QC12_9AGAR|nr:hypothetical protein BDP27DRAFT_1460348 [Rhodocollybia butyracea]
MLQRSRTCSPSFLGLHLIHSAAKNRTIIPIIRLANNLKLPAGPWKDPGKKNILSFQNDDEWSESHGRDGFASDPCIEEVVPFFMDRNSLEPVGFLRSRVFGALLASLGTFQSPWEADSTSVRFAPWVNAHRDPVSVRSFAIDTLVKQWRSESLFSDILGKESSEHFPVYRSKLEFGQNLQCAIERPALPLFGFPNYGSLLIVYFICPNTNKTMIWVPRRSMTKRTFPGMLDVTVGGGIANDCTPLSTIIQEAHEEARLDETYVRERIFTTGFLEFRHRNPDGWILPGVYFTFELEAEPSVRPVPHDGEVECFELMDAQTVFDNILEGKFKGSSALAMIRFLSRRNWQDEGMAPLPYL